MSSRRLLLHDILCGILSCPTEGVDCRAYFQPPASKEMKYPAIVYALNKVKTGHANNGVYFSDKNYSVTLIDRNPDTELTDKILELPNCKFDRSYPSNNLNHYVFELYF